MIQLDLKFFEYAVYIIINKFWKIKKSRPSLQTCKQKC